MAERFSINMIIPETQDWTCKVQLVDKCRPGNNKYRNKKYQLLILQDEEENQVQAIIFGTDIMHFEDVFTPFNTYLVFVAQVKKPASGYESSLNDYIWTIDRSTMLRPLKMLLLLKICYHDQRG
ncbi:uncharacterized protein LOC107854158 [Capsicum annuum]|uniref:uncharacterized protein LOC107854158 n=1 Tax=Capsicum annuum TaxID=4072 RepID=UPI001FB04F24|nr:uncharacterized protein LOC107854158 [Capsicum annuum]